MGNFHRVALLSVLLLATWLRWQQLDLVDYSYDEAHITGMAQGVAAMNGYAPLLSGGTSIGLPRSALQVYLLALPLLLTGGRIESEVWLIGALGVVSVALTYVLARKMSQQLFGSYSSARVIDGGNHPNLGSTPHSALTLCSIFYMSANPWLVYFDRKLWAHIHVVLSVALLLLAWQVVVEERRRAVLWFALLASLQFLSHVLALVQALCWLSGLLVRPRQWLHGYGVSGALLGIILLVPYAWALSQQVQQSPIDVAARFTTVLSPLMTSANPFSSPSWLFAWQLLTGTGISSVVGQTEMANHWWVNGRMFVAPLVALFCLVGMIGIFCYNNPQRSDKEKIRIVKQVLLVWPVGPLVLFSLWPEHVFLHYWTVLLPWPALLFSLGMALPIATISQRRERAAWVARSVFSVTLLITIIWIGGYFSLMTVYAEGQDRAPLRNWRIVMNAVHKAAVAADTQEVRVAVAGVDPGYEAEPAIVATLIGNPPFARFVAPTSPPALLFSAERPSLYFWRIAAPETESVLQSWGEQIWQGYLVPGGDQARLYRLPPFNQTQLPYTLLDPAPHFDAGLQLIGYIFPHTARAQQPFSVTLLWHVIDPPAAIRQRDLTAFNHLLDANGQMVGQYDGLALLSRDWWPGDVLFQPYWVQLPAGEYRWRTGLYSRVDGRRSLTAEQQDFVDLPGLQVK